MNLRVAIFTAVLCLLQYLCTEAKRYRKIGGHSANIRDHRHQAAVIIKSHGCARFQGGAIIVSKRWVLTAANCISRISDHHFKKRHVYIRGNTAYWKGGHCCKDHKVKKAYMHPQFNINSKDYDLGLMRVSPRFNGRYEKRIKVVNSNFKYQNNARVVISGWSTLYYSEHLKPVHRLRAATVRIVNWKFCQTVYQTGNMSISSNMLCAWDKEKKVCVFDVGGPLTQNNVLIGIVSWGVKCGSKMYPDVYVDLAKFYDFFKQFALQHNVKLGIWFTDGVYDQK